MAALLSLPCETRTAAAGAGNSIDVLRCGYLPIADCGQLFVARQRGLFKSEGISQVEMSPFQGGQQMLEALGGGHLDLAFTNVVSLLEARAQGLPFQAIAGGPVEDPAHAEHAILVRTDSPIRGPADLRSKVIALNALNNIDHWYLKRYLEGAGLHEGDCQLTEMPFAAMPQSLVRKQLDAACCVEPYVTVARKDASLRVLDFHYVKVARRIEISAYVVAESWRKQHPRAVGQVRRALASATATISTSPASLPAALLEFTGLTAAQLKSVSLPTFTTSLDRGALQRLADEMAKAGWTSRPVLARDCIVP